MYRKLKSKLTEWADKYEASSFCDNDPARSDFALFGYTIRKASK